LIWMSRMHKGRNLGKFNFSCVFNLHHYKNDCLFSVLDLQLQELNARFGEENY
jgi:hypothetical protein